MNQATFFRTYSPLAIRPDIVEAHWQVWQNLAQAGNWLTGHQRVAIMAETRSARTCPYCKLRKRALSLYAVKGEHDVVTKLDPAWIDAIHRIVTDPGRLSRRLLEDLAGVGVDDAMYVEILSVVLFTLDIDMFHRAVGIDNLPLPLPAEGDPCQERPSLLEAIGAWVPVISVKSPIAKEFFAGAVRISNVARGLSLVPEATRDQIKLVEAQYVPLTEVASFGECGRSISRAQMELIASRVSALNGCFY